MFARLEMKDGFVKYMDVPDGMLVKVRRAKGISPLSSEDDGSVVDNEAVEFVYVGDKKSLVEMSNGLYAICKTPVYGEH